MPLELIVATHNPSKLQEYRSLLKPLGYVVRSAADFPEDSDPEETGASYGENAKIKALALTKRLKRPVIADDSGIEIAALDGFPGIFSARFAQSLGGDYAKVNAEILRRLYGVANRKAAYHCVLCLLEAENAKPHYFEGICEGSILLAPHGEGGFGYDPIFHYDAGDLDFGTASESEKNAVSHRGIALRKLLAYATQNKL